MIGHPFYLPLFRNDTLEIRWIVTGTASISLLILEKYFGMIPLSSKGQRSSITYGKGTTKWVSDGRFMVDAEGFKDSCM